MSSLEQLKITFEALRIQGDINTLHKLTGKDFRIYRRNLKTFLQDFKTETSDMDDNEVLDAFGETKKKVNLKLNDLSVRVEKEKFNKSPKGRFGFSRPPTLEKEAAKKAKLAKEQEERKGEIAEKSEQIKQMKAQIKKERAERSRQKFGSNDTAASSTTFLTVVGDAASHAVIPPLMPWDVEELQRRRDALDELEAIKKVYDLNDDNLKGILLTAKRVAAGAGSVVAKFVEETTGGVFKAVTLFLAWPIVIPVKLLNTALVAAKWACCGVDSFLALADKSLDLLAGRFDRDKETKEVLPTLPNILRGASYVIRGPIKAARLLAQTLAKGFRIAETFINFDKWAKKKPVMVGFAVGGVGTVLIIAFTLVSIFSFGIPIAALAGGLIAATVGAAIGGFIKAKLKKNELKDLQLSSFEATQLDKWEYDREHRKEQAPKPHAEVKHVTESVENVQKDRLEHVKKEIHLGPHEEDRPDHSKSVLHQRDSVVMKSKDKDKEKNKEKEKDEDKKGPDVPDPDIF